MSRVVVITLILGLTGCVFTVEHDMIELRDAGDHDGDADTETNNGEEPLTVFFTETPNTLVHLEYGESLAFAFACRPAQHCLTQCRLSPQDSWQVCTSGEAFAVEEEGDFFFEMRAVDQDQATETSDVVGLSVAVRFVFEIDISLPETASHPYLGPFTAACLQLPERTERSDGCVVSWAWGEEEFPDCSVGEACVSSDEPFALEIPDFDAEEFTLRVRACARDYENAEIPHCEEKEHFIERVAPAFRQVAAGHSHACAILEDDTLWCWGANSFGQLGTGDTDPRSMPAPVSGHLRWKDVSVGAEHSCGITTDAALYCWGRGGMHQLGQGTGNRHTPHRATDSVEADWEQVSAGREHSCAVTTQGLLYCWGRNAHFQLGSTVPSSAPLGAPITSPTNTSWSAVSAGYEHTCALAPEGTAYCWGNESSGQLGNDSIDGQVAMPQPLALNAEQVEFIAAGGEHSCATAFLNETEGRFLLCWGRNDSGQVGINRSDVSIFRTPRELGVQPSAQVAPATGGSHSCVVGHDQKLYCWGENANGQLGITEPGNRFAPEVVAGMDFVTSLANGDRFSCAIADAKLYCWGQGGPRLGQGPDATNNVPFPTEVLWPYPNAQ